jgi:hypothetical protein
MSLLRAASAGVVLAMACACSAAAPADAPAPRIDATPERLFAGTTTGRGTLRLGWGAPRRFRVRSTGTPQADGSFRLEQVVTFDGQAPRRRRWILRREGANRYSFDLSDAAGAGEARVDGGRLVLDYPLPRGLRMHQVLVPAADGRSIANAGRLRWLGLTVGRLTETIERIP